VSNNVDCQAFQDQLDALKEGTLPEEGLHQLRLHAAACADCAMLFRMYEHLASLPQDEMEAAVPGELVDSMWPRVQKEIDQRESPSVREPVPPWKWRWLVPALSAASILLFVSAALLFSQVRQLQERERVLALKIAELDVRTSPATAAGASGLLDPRRWERLLARREEVTPAEIGYVLARLPSRETILDPRTAQVLVRRLALWEPFAKNRLSDIRTHDGLQAGEALQILDALDLEPGESIPTARILAHSRSLVLEGEL
jgi:hypothetical protein